MTLLLMMMLVCWGHVRLGSQRLVGSPSIKRHDPAIQRRSALGCKSTPGATWFTALCCQPGTLLKRPSLQAYIFTAAPSDLPALSPHTLSGEVGLARHLLQVLGCRLNCPFACREFCSTFTKMAFLLLRTHALLHGVSSTCYSQPPFAMPPLAEYGEAALRS